MGTLAEEADAIRKRGVELIAEFTQDELLGLWCRLPNVTGEPPSGSRGLSERVALYLSDSGHGSAKMVEVRKLLDVAPVRALPYETKPAAKAKGDEMTTTTAPQPPTDRPKVARSKPVSLKPSAAIKVPADKPTVTKPPQAAKKAPAKTAAKPAAKKTVAKTASVPKVKGVPRPGTITAFVVDAAKAGTAFDEIVKCARSKFSESESLMDNTAAVVRWYIWDARRKGYLPKNAAVPKAKAKVVSKKK